MCGRRNDRATQCVIVCSAAALPPRTCVSHILGRALVDEHKELGNATKKKRWDRWVQLTCVPRFKSAALVESSAIAKN